ncbi:MFS transporter [Ignatzschineria rhizosphaerae]|uniref:MFS transporter n=1 Tax=Ignatzschineria rhizosphaerae TaxID=2923279 RepID=A0ABY3X2R2_9GAMM|nr:MFS transporter [Ignatzschineria rhizosphaerae]UNM95747.1 MFS transporter [Ignatzschineria rhizosphaerae]
MNLTTTSSANGSWLALLSATFACFIIVTGEFLAIGVLNNIAEDFQISSGTAGLTVTVTSIAGMFSALIIPIYAKSMDRRAVLLVLTILMVAANLVTALASNFAFVLLGRFFLGIALGGFWGVAAGLVIRIAPKQLPTALAVTIFFSAVTLVTVLGVPIGAWLANQYDWRMPYWVLVALGMVAFLMLYFSLPSLKPSSSLKWKELLLMPSHPIARKGLILFILIFLAHFAAYNYFTAFFKQSAGFSDGEISGLLLAFGVASVFGNILAGYFGKYNVRYNFAIMALLLGIVFLAFAMSDLLLMQTLFLVAIWGIAAGMIPSSINIWMYVHVPHLVEKGSALVTFMFLILITIGSLLGGFILDHFNGITLMSVAALTGLFAFTLVLTMTRGVRNVAVNSCPSC